MSFPPDSADAYPGLSAPARATESLPRPTLNTLARFSPFLGLVLGLACPALVVPVAHAQTFDTPQAAAADPDFAIQGEYAGGQQALQVVARGAGEFEIVVYEGGLPGAGWDGVSPRRFDGDADVVADLVESMELERVERQSPTLGAAPPPAAIVLFDGSSQSVQSNWNPGAKLSEQGWLQQGATTRQLFGDYTLHLEFRTPFMPAAEGQGRGNSGVYHQGRYETQILDSFGTGGADNEAGGIYGVHAPTLNMCLPPLQWQTYDIDFTAARYDASGQKTRDARLTVRLNGRVVQANVPVPAATRAAPQGESPQDGPLHLQDHGNPVRFRNVWLLPRDAEAEARRPRIPAFERFFAGGIGDPADGGQVLLAGLSCTACHQGDLPIPDKRGPDLSEVGRRVRPDHLLAMIADPHGTKPGTTMPDVWTGVSQAEKLRQARAIASFLAAGKQPIDRPGDRSAVERGGELYRTIGCLACHDSQDKDARNLATSVPLGQLDQKYTLDSLTDFLLDPHTVRPGMRMPRLVADRIEARDIASYLLQDVVIVPGSEKFAYRVYEGSWDKLPEFETLKPVATGRSHELDIAVAERQDAFGMVFETYLPIATAGQYTFHVASDDGARVLVGSQEAVVHDGIHPATRRSGSLELDAGVHPLRIEYFEKAGQQELRLSVDGPDFKEADITSLVTSDPDGQSNQQLIEPTFRPDPNLVETGAAAFRQMGCVACHAVGSLEPAAGRAPSLAALKNDAGEGCLAETPPAGVPNYRLSPQQRHAIVAALAKVGEATPPQQRIRQTMAGLNCYACHERDGRGGPEASRDASFQTTTPEMGNEGRLPPSLTGVGDKLNDAYLADILQNGAEERPYMKTRMPAFQYEPLRGLHEDLRATDRQALAQIPNNPHSPTLIASQGRKLVGDKGLACIKCHTFGGIGLEGIGALDALHWPKRLRRDWFHRYLRDPQRYRPGTRMPASFVDGKSALETVYDGDPGLQIDAIWAYLNQEDPKPPRGLVPGAIVLTPRDTPIIYRNFLTQLSPRGIAVGYPEDVNLAWDAHRMGVVLIWQNEFIDASKHWVGRGPGQQAPLGDATIVIDTHTPLAVLPSPAASWPQTEGRERGYQFLGYRLNESRQPVFRYRFDGNEVEDFCQPIAGTADERGFDRTLRIVNDDPQATRYLLAGSGASIQPLGEGVYRVEGGAKVRVEGAGQGHIVAGDHGQQLRYALPANATVTIRQTLRW
ncbi:family 16 glycoside hydrolase [Roseimaritima sediminicola]|uniref:family 16 glycoside hydrolase n=1 Tax=Roseimaritima sediminicola TaxID=2662066 RepID=UPI0012983D39|nr:family 16 glycoside hydrolase [Roseimaritima sediminicola]